jgi:hypothetical protein
MGQGRYSPPVCIGTKTKVRRGDPDPAKVAIHFMHYNFARPHKTLANLYPRTPAMASGIADHAWSLREIAELSD